MAVYFGFVFALFLARHCGRRIHLVSLLLRADSSSCLVTCMRSLLSTLFDVDACIQDKYEYMGLVRDDEIINWPNYFNLGTHFWTLNIKYVLEYFSHSKF